MEIVITGQIVCSLSLSRSVNFVPVQYYNEEINLTISKLLEDLLYFFLLSVLSLFLIATKHT